MNTKTVFTKAFLKSLDEYLVGMKTKQMEWRDISQKGLSVILYLSGRKVFYFTYTYRKQRYRERLGDTQTLSLTLAREMTQHLRCAIQMGENPIGQRKKGEIHFEMVVKEYLVHTKPLKASYRDDESKCRRHILPHFGKKPLNTILTTSIESYHGKIARTLSPPSANRHLALLQAIFTFAKKQKLISISPAEGIAPFPEETKEKKYMTLDEMRALLLALDMEENLEAVAILKFMSMTALRSGNARFAKLENYDQTNGTLLIPMTKGGKGQRLALSDKARAIVEEQVQKHGNKGYLFRGIDMVSPISDPANVMKRACKRANIEIYTPHSLRHSYAVIALELGISIYQLKEALNHQSVATTNIYASISNKKQRAINNQVADLII